MKSVLAALARRRARFGDRRRKLQWLLLNRHAAATCPIFIVGAQRSGTGMLGECLGRSPEIQNLGESDPRAFDRYSLRDLHAIEDLIARCRYRFLVFKPLKDSHRVAELLGLSDVSKVIWAYRNYSDRINSAVQKFRGRPLEVFNAFRHGDRNRWQMQGLSMRTAETVLELDLASLSESDGAALMWWVRNSLYFDQGLERLVGVRLWSYDSFVNAPEVELRSLLAFLGADLHPAMLNSIHNQSVGKEPAPAIHPKIRDLCDALHEQLEGARLAQSP